MKSSGVLTERNPVVAELLDYEQEFRRDPLLWRQYLMDERAHFDYLANLKYEREEGMDMKAIEIAQKARAEGFMTDEQIAELVGLPVNVVREL